MTNIVLILLITSNIVSWVAIAFLLFCEREHWELIKMMMKVSETDLRYIKSIHELAICTSKHVDLMQQRIDWDATET